MRKKWLVFLIIAGIVFLKFGRRYWGPVYRSLMGAQTTAQVIDKYGEKSREKFNVLFANVNVSYPPSKVAFLAFKDTRKMEVWAAKETSWVKVTEYPILGASGYAGPKLQEGDRQVPEGIYTIIGFNPNSSYHLSMKINYPNAFDLKWAKQEGRENPGSDIFIHGVDLSIGCLAMGNPAIEELFVLSYDVKLKNISVIIAPKDARIAPLTPPEGSALWVTELYTNITKQLQEYR